MKTILGILAILGVAFGAYFYIDDRYAQCEDVKKIEQRLDYKIISDQIDFKDQRATTIKSRYPDQLKMPNMIKEEFDRLKKEKKLLEKKLEALEKK
jgi:hypothetical protein